MSTAGPVASALLLAAALLLTPGRSIQVRARLPLDATPARRTGRTAAVLPVACGFAVGLLATVLVGGVTGLLAGLLVGGLGAVGARHWLRGSTRLPGRAAELAGGWDLLAACLRAGLPVASATRAVAGQVPGQDGAVLRTVAELLAIGSDPVEAWRPALANPATAALAMIARRTAHSGAAMAGAVAELAVQVRAEAADLDEERAQRAAVLITGPLGLCFLPAFFCLGVLPVVVGLAGQLLHHW